MAERIRVPARALKPGDITGSGETVLRVSAGVRTPRGKVEVTLEKDGCTRPAIWGASTLITVFREPAPASMDLMAALRASVALIDAGR